MCYIYNYLAQVYEVSFWLMKYGCPSPKRLLLKSNWRHINLMDLGKLPREERIRLTTVTTSRVLLSTQFLMHGYRPNMHVYIYKVVLASTGVVQGVSKKHSGGLSVTMKVYIYIYSF